MSTLHNLKEYENALKRWKERGGLTGGGGDYDRKNNKRLPASEPTPGEFHLGPEIKRFADQIRERVFAK